MCCFVLAAGPLKGRTPTSSEIQNSTMTGGTRPTLHQLGASCNATPDRNALMDRLKDDPDLKPSWRSTSPDTATLRKEVVAETKRADQIEYVRTAVEEGTIKTPAGLIIEIPSEVKAEAEQRLVPSDQDKQSGPAEAAAAYEVLHDFVAHSIDNNPRFRIQERRAKLHGRVRQASKTFEQLSLDEVDELYDEELVERLEQLHGYITACIQNLKAATQRPALRAVGNA